MKTVKGKLKKSKSGFMVTLPSKKGSADHAIPEAARRFQLSDGSDGLEVDVTLNEKSLIVKVVIPGKPEVANAPSAPPPRHGSSRKQGARSTDHRSSLQRPPDSTAIRKKVKASPKVLGMPFHNPYTFLPFGKTPPRRRQPTAWSVDELPDEKDRLTGVLELQIMTKSPLLTADPSPVIADASRRNQTEGHRTFEALRIGPDVIVPASGIRGALRTLLTVLTGGTLGHLNAHTYLCQGRDAKLGPRSEKSPPITPLNPFLAEVIQPGSEFRAGRIRLGETHLIALDVLKACCARSMQGDLDKLRDQRKPTNLWVGLDRDRNPIAFSSENTTATPWRLKLSGRPIKWKGKREGVVLLDETRVLELPAEFWAEYSGRHAHGDHSVLGKGDLIWLEPTDVEAKTITKAADIRSIQWSRWGKRGQSLKQLLSKTQPHVLPDYLQPDGQVDEVTDLFGQVASERGIDAAAFAGRIRAENLVFMDAATQLNRRVTLAPLSVPHPGCVAFYRDNDNPDDASIDDPLRGYKVYRTTSERGDSAPWLFQSQGVYGDQGELKNPQQNLNKTCDLVPEGLKGTLRIAFRSLTVRELALLLQACAVPWRLGGGKPLGLGLCRVAVRELHDEEGEPLVVPDWQVSRGPDGTLKFDGWANEVADIQDRVRMWVASQTPVPLLRYPRAVERNQHKLARGGHAWFQRHALPRLVDEKGTDTREPGLKPLYVDGSLKSTIEAAGERLDATTPLVAGQVLPKFNAESPLSDVLYGFDGYGANVEEREQPNRKVYLEIEPFDPTNSKHVTGTEQSSGSHDKNAASRRQEKQNRPQRD